MKVYALALGLMTTSASIQAAGAETLALYKWGDYINPEILAGFTAETGIEVGRWH